MNDNADNVVTLDVITRLNLPASRVLQAALDSDVKDVVIMGYTKDGQEYFASNLADGGTVLWLMERSKKRLLDIPERFD